MENVYQNTPSNDLPGAFWYTEKTDISQKPDRLNVKRLNLKVIRCKLDFLQYVMKPSVCKCKMKTCTKLPRSPLPHPRVSCYDQILIINKLLLK